MTAQQDLERAVRDGLGQSMIDVLAVAEVVAGQARILILDGEVHRVSAANDMGCPTDRDRLYEVWIEER